MSTCEQFERDYNLSCKNNKTMSEIVNQIIRSTGYTLDELQEKSQIDRRTLYRLKTGTIKTKKRTMDYFPSMKTLVAFSIACNLDLLNAETLLNSLGLAFNRTNKVHYAYWYIIKDCRGKSISDCNKVLKSLGIADDDLLRDPDGV